MQSYPFHLTYTKVNEKSEDDINQMSQLASKIVKEYYDPILGAEQNDYMIDKFQSPKAIKEQLSKGYQYYFVVNTENKKLGFLAFYKRDDELYLSKLYLLKEERGKKYSKDMLNFVITKCHEINLHKVTLNVNKYNISVEIYKKLGFKKIRDEKIDIGHGYYMDDYVFQYDC